ncbi:sarcosine oxidase subunit gamma [Leptospira interrogans]
MSALETLSPIAKALKPGRHGAPGDAPVVLTERRLAVVQVQARKNQDAALTNALSAAFGLRLPEPGHASTAGEWSAVWIQPGMWLVTSPFTGPGDLLNRLATIVGTTASLTDQTFGKTVLRLAGPHARDVLAKGCRVDLHPRVFGPGQSAVTPLSQVSCVLAQVDDKPTFDLIVPSTFAVAAVEWLEIAAAEYGLEVSVPGG